MLADNLLLLRTVRGLTQEDIAEKIGTSRQSYAKYESGEVVPDAEKCDLLASFYGVTLDELIRGKNKVGNTRLAPAPAGKHLFGTVALGAKGQIVIPKAARETFELHEGDKLVVLVDESEGIALVKAVDFEKKMHTALALGRRDAER